MFVEIIFIGKLLVRKNELKWVRNWVFRGLTCFLNLAMVTNQRMFRFPNGFEPFFVLEDVEVRLLLKLCQLAVDISVIVTLFFSVSYFSTKFNPTCAGLFK